MSYSKQHIITSAHNAPESSILIIYTGGTLGMVHDEKGALVPFDFGSILNHVPSLRKLELNLTVISFKEPIDSSNINPDDWVKIGQIIFDNYNDFNGFVVLHGTDTMAFSASAMSFMLENLSKPVIFTGAQLPISSLRSDARENLITALEIASGRSESGLLIPEVCIYFDYVLLRGNRSKKVQSLHFDAFESENYPVMAESGVVIRYNPAVIRKLEGGNLKLHNKFDTRIVILKLYPGISKAAVRAILGIEGLRGVVLETFGSGNAPSSEWFLKLIKEAVDKQIVMLNVSQCPGGRVVHGQYDTSQQLNELGVIEGADLTLEAAITKLMLILGEEYDMETIRKRLVTPICGEMTLN